MDTRLWPRLQAVDQSGDPQLTQYIEDMLQDQVLAEQYQWYHRVAALRSSQQAQSLARHRLALTEEELLRRGAPPWHTLLQVEDIKKAADYVSQLRRVGTGHGECGASRKAAAAAAAAAQAQAPANPSGPCNTSSGYRRLGV